MENMTITTHYVERKQVGYATPSIAVPAIAYYSGDRVWYAITVPYGALRSGLVKTSSIKKRGQEIIKHEIKNRFLDKEHKNGIKEYMKEEKKFTIPPITLVCTDKLPFEPIILGQKDTINTMDDFYNALKQVGSMGGIIQIPLDYQFECLDGNHRTVAIRELAEEMPDITQGSHLLLNIVCEDDILKIRQDFVDVNKNAKQTTPSINTLFNTRDPIPNIVSTILNEIKYLEDLTELISTSISKNSNDIYTLNNIKNAVIEIAGFDSQGGKNTEIKVNKLLKSNASEKEQVYKNSKMLFELIQHNEYINQCIENKARVKEVRQEALITSGVGLIIVASIAKYILDNFAVNEYKYQFDRLMRYDWSRRNNIFVRSGIIDESGTIANSRSIIGMTKSAILRDLGYSEESGKKGVQE